MQRATWTDERLDEFARHVDRQFEQIDKRFDRVETEIRGVRTDVKQDMVSLRSGLDGLTASFQAWSIATNRATIAMAICLVGVLAAALLAG